MTVVKNTKAHHDKEVESDNSSSISEGKNSVVKVGKIAISLFSKKKFWSLIIYNCMVI